MDAEANLVQYLGRRGPADRYTSFDYCFNYFQDHRERDNLEHLLTGEQLRLACLHLAFYLASWGMLRGSSPLLQRSVKHYEPVVEAVVRADRRIWSIDAHSYDRANIELILSSARSLRASLPDAASDILITKIMLGVFGCVPAFDTYFKKGIGVWSFGEKPLSKVGEFYATNADLIERYRIYTIDFESSQPTVRRYTAAKVIDMVFFVEGSK